MTNKVDLYNDWELNNAFDKIIDDNCKEIPYEGTEVDHEGIKHDLYDFLIKNHYSLLNHKK